MRIMFSLCALAFCACLGGTPPPTESGTRFEGGCSATESGNACLTLRYFAAERVRGQAKALSGTLHWSVYKGGEVGVLGPGDHSPLATGAAEQVDLAAEGSYAEIDVPNLPSEHYQVLGFLDVSGSGSSSAVAGDPVTLPKDPFRIPPDRHFTLQVPLDYVR